MGLIIYYQVRHAQYLGFHLGPGVSHFIRALKDLRLAGLFFLITIRLPCADFPPNPKLTLTTLPLSFLTFLLFCDYVFHY
jgi:hypothetical protein